MKKINEISRSVSTFSWNLGLFQLAFSWKIDPVENLSTVFLVTVKSNYWSSASIVFCVVLFRSLKLLIVACIIMLHFTVDAVEYLHHVNPIISWKDVVSFLPRAVFEKKNQKTNALVAQLQKKLEKYHNTVTVSITSQLDYELEISIAW